MSSALSFANGRGMSSSERLTSPFTFTSNAPLRGFSALMVIVAAGKAAFTRASSFVDLVLNAPQDLQASISTRAPPPDAGAALAGGAFFFPAALSMVFLGGMWADQSVEGRLRRRRTFARLARRSPSLNREDLHGNVSFLFQWNDVASNTWRPLLFASFLQERGELYPDARHWLPDATGATQRRPCGCHGPINRLPEQALATHYENNCVKAASCIFSRKMSN